MKPSLFLLASSALAFGAPPVLQLDRGATGELRFTVEDPSNGRWRLQASSDLRYWSDVGDFQVHNTYARSPFVSSEQLPANHWYRLVPSGEPEPRELARVLSLPETVHPYDAPLPNSAARRSLRRGSISPEAATLGRVLFYDHRLSADRTVSCASCHLQQHAFADPRRFSTGLHGVRSARNAPTLLSVPTYSRRGLFADGRTGNLIAAIDQVLENPDEFDNDADRIARELSGEPYYRQLSLAAFGSETLRGSQVLLALADFIEAMPAASSRYDQATMDRFASFTSDESAGLQLYRQHCAACHREGAFSGSGFANTGLDLVPRDPGRGGITGSAKDMGAFAIPSLRNVGVTAPYMHDGRFATLREVIDFYDHGIQDTPTLSRFLTPDPLGLTETEKQQLEAFLLTLTDVQVLDDPAFSDPFVAIEVPAPAAGSPPAPAERRAGLRVRRPPLADPAGTGRLSPRTSPGTPR